MAVVTYALKEVVKASSLLLPATLGEIYAERSGVINLSIEGMMLVSAVVAFMVAHNTGNPWLGLLAALAAGVAMSAIHALASISFQANQIISGLALCILGAGLSSVMGKPYVGIRRAFKPIGPLPIPFLSDIPLVGPAFFNQSPLVYTAFLATGLCWFCLLYTSPSPRDRG